MFGEAVPRGSEGGAVWLGLAWVRSARTDRMRTVVRQPGSSGGRAIRDWASVRDPRDLSAGAPRGWGSHAAPIFGASPLRERVCHPRRVGEAAVCPCPCPQALWTGGQATASARATRYDPLLNQAEMNPGSRKQRLLRQALAPSGFVSGGVGNESGGRFHFREAGGARRAPAEPCERPDSLTAGSNVESNAPGPSANRPRHVFPLLA